MINIQDIAKKREKSIKEKTRQLSNLVIKCDPPPDGPDVIGWLVNQVANMKISNVIGQVGMNAKRNATEDFPLDESHEAELMKAIEMFTLILNTHKPKSKIVTAAGKLVMPSSGVRH